jgi:hypothetical protein
MAARGFTTATTTGVTTTGVTATGVIGDQAKEKGRRVGGPFYG